MSKMGKPKKALWWLEAQDSQRIIVYGWYVVFHSLSPFGGNTNVIYHVLNQMTAPTIKGKL